MSDFSCFKTYDIRGEIDKNIDKYICARIATAFSSTLNAKKVVIGHDVRETSPIYSKEIIISSTYCKIKFWDSIINTHDETSCRGLSEICFISKS